MEEGDGDDDGDSEHSSDLSGDSDGMDDDQDEDDENSIIDMLEEQQMEDQVDGADGWTTDTDSAEEEEEIDEEEEEEANEDEFDGFPPPSFPIIDPDEHGMDFDEDLDDHADIEEFREMMGNLHDQIFDQMPDEEEDDEDEDNPRHHHQNWVSLGRTHTLRHGGIFLLVCCLLQEVFNFEEVVSSAMIVEILLHDHVQPSYAVPNVYSFAPSSKFDRQYPPYDDE